MFLFFTAVQQWLHPLRFLQVESRNFTSVHLVVDRRPFPVSLHEEDSCFLSPGLKGAKQRKRGNKQVVRGQTKSLQSVSYILFAVCMQRVTLPAPQTTAESPNFLILLHSFIHPHPKSQLSQLGSNNRSSLTVRQCLFLTDTELQIGK